MARARELEVKEVGTVRNGNGNWRKGMGTGREGDGNWRKGVRTGREGSTS